MELEQTTHSKKVFHFEAIVYTCPEAKKVLKEFMKSERNDENLILLEQLSFLKEELKRVNSSSSNFNTILNDIKHWKSAVEQLLSQYLSLENPVANVSRECTKLVLNSWNELRKENSKEIIFQQFEKAVKPLEVSLLVMMKSDMFPRFVRSNIWLNYIARLKPTAVREAFLNKVTVDDNVYQMEKSFQYTMKMLFASPISLRDYQFAKMISEDDLASNWTFVAYDKKRTKVSLFVNLTKSFLSDQSVADETKLVSVSKYIGYLPYDLETCVQGIAGTLHQVRLMIPDVSRLDFVNLVEPSTHEQTDLEYCFPQAHYTHQTDFKIPLLQLREGESNISLFKLEQQNAYLCILKSTALDIHPYTSHSISLPHFMCIYFTKSLYNSNETRYVYTFLGDGGGWLRGKFNKLSAELNKKRSISQHKHYVRVVEKWAALSEEAKKQEIEKDSAKLLQRIQIMK